MNSSFITFLRYITTKFTARAWLCRKLGAEQSDLKEERKLWGDGTALVNTREI